MDAKTAIVQVIRGARSTTGERRPIAVFDIDATLFNSAARSLQIVREFCEENPELEPFVRKLEIETMGYRLWDSLRAVGAADEELLLRLKSFWRARFFDGSYLCYDQPYPGAAELVNQVAQAGILVYYLTGRDTPRMREGTLKSLKAHAFPTDDMVLRTKSRWDEPDLAYKTAAIEELRGLGRVILAIENEPANANLLAEAFPAATVALHDTYCSPDPPPLLPEVLRLPDLVFEWVP